MQTQNCFTKTITIQGFIFEIKFLFIKSSNILSHPESQPNTYACRCTYCRPEFETALKKIYGLIKLISYDEVKYNDSLPELIKQIEIECANAVKLIYTATELNNNHAIYLISQGFKHTEV